MSKCGHCPIAGACYGESQAWACKFGLPEANPTQSLFLRERSGEPIAPAEPVEAAEAPVYPSLPRQLANLVGSALAFARSGGELVDEAEFQRRRSICLACPTGRYVESENRCSACGCWMAWKPYAKSAACDDGHW